MRGEPVKSWVFGTGEDCDVRVKDDPRISTRHCKVTLYEDGSATVEDLGSVNGTYLRGEGPMDPIPGARVLYRPVNIRPGMVIRIGRTDIPWRKS